MATSEPDSQVVEGDRFDGSSGGRTYTGRGSQSHRQSGDEGDLAAREGDDRTSTQEPAVQLGTKRRSSRGTRWRWAFFVSLALLVGACGYAGYVTSTNQVNKSRALAWEAKAVLLQSNVQRLEVKIASRTRSLNHRTSLLNSLLAKLSHARAEINSSQSDVNTLESRQRALADEKAKVEDERAAAEQEASALAAQTSALRNVASAYISCNQQLFELSSHALKNDVTWIDVNYQTISATCDEANSQLQSYLNVYGG